MAAKELRWYQGHLLKLNLCLLSVVLFSSSQGFDGTLSNGLQSLPPWNEFMDHPKSAILGLITFSYWVGMFFGFFFSPAIANIWGRKKAIYIGTAIAFAGMAIQSAAPNKAAFIGARAVLGAGSAFWGTAAPLLIGETSHPKYRGKFTAMYMAGFHVGATIAAWACFGSRGYTNDWSWRIPSILQYLLPVVALPGFMLLPESPRWLIANDRSEEARAMLIKWHAGGDESSQMVALELQEIQAHLDYEKRIANNASYMEMISTPGNRKRTWITISIGLSTNWVGVGIVSYYLAIILNNVGVTDTSTQLIINACINMWNILWSFFGALQVDMMGRRMLFLTSGGIMLVSFILITAISGAFAETLKSPIGLAVIPFLFIFYGGYDIALTPLSAAYPAEIWPYRLRSRGITLQWLFGVGGAAVNTFVNPIALDAIAWKYYFVYIAVLILFIINAWFCYPETRGYSLEEICVLFDGDDARLDDINADAKVNETVTIKEHAEAESL